jgi:hypothetical protein
MEFTLENVDPNSDSLVVMIIQIMAMHTQVEALPLLFGQDKSYLYLPVGAAVKCMMGRLTFLITIGPCCMPGGT